MSDLAALQSRVRVMADDSRASAQRNRERAPEFAAFVADLRRVFGDGCRVAWVQWPDGSEQGKRQPGPGVVPYIPPKKSRGGIDKTETAGRK